MTGIPGASTADHERPRGRSQPPIFYGIEGLRGIGVMVVMIYHVLGAEPEKRLPGAPFVVDFFYAVSGFVLSHVYAERLARDLGGLRFMRLRLIRVYPLYLLALGAAAATSLWMARSTGLPEPGLFGLSITASALLIPLIQPLAWRHHHPYPLNAPTWTLFWELGVNLIWSLLGARLTNRLLALIVAVGAVMLLIALSLPTKLENGGAFENFHVGGLRVVYGFFAGVAAYRLWAHGYLAWLRLPFWASALALAALVLLRPIGGTVFYDLGAVLVMPALVFASTPPPPRFLIPLCATLGRIAYGMYILNFPILLAFDAILPHLPIPALVVPVVRIPGFIIVTFAVALAADRWLDRPVRRWLTRHLVSARASHAPGDHDYGDRGPQKARRP